MMTEKLKREIPHIVNIIWNQERSISQIYHVLKFDAFFCNVKSPLKTASSSIGINKEWSAINL